jgi:hypothetical protein
MNGSREARQQSSLLAIFALGLVLLIWADAARMRVLAGEPGGLPTSAPQASLTAFYHWYLGALANDRHPLRDDRTQVERYVSKELLQEIDRRANNPEGLGEDYFIEAQDFLEDWASNIVVSNVRIDGRVASALVTLGATKQSRHRLALNLINEGNMWKVSKVSRPSVRLQATSS